MNTLSGDRYGLVVVLAFLCAHIACTDKSTSPSVYQDFPDVGLGCTVERIESDQWRVSCPDGPDAVHDQNNAQLTDATVFGGQDATPIVDVPPSRAEAGMERGLADLGTDSQDGSTNNNPNGSSDRDQGQEPDSFRQDCEPPLALRATRQAVSPFTLVRFEASGGSGQWRFQLSENNSGSTLNGDTGLYLAGESTDVSDEVTLTDLRCEGSARALVQVVEPMKVAPLEPELEPGDIVEFAAIQGSGQFELIQSVNRSGGEILDNLRYRAGQETGIDVLVIRDTETLTEKTITVTVKHDVRLVVTPPVIYVPAGTSLPISVRGGSGIYDYDGPPGLQLQEDRFTADEAGTYVVEVNDRYGARSTRFTVVAMTTFEANIAPVNDHTLSERVVELGDMNGDNMVDIAVARAESDGQAHNGGEVAIFLSNGDGFNPEPDQKFYGMDREDELGRALTAADVNGDGLTDLIYGVRFADNNGRNSGSLLIHLGQPEGGFNDAPMIVLNGPDQDLEFGFSVTTCDFNGDGLTDIAIGARGFEDRTVANVQWDHGGILIHLGHEDGFLHRYDQLITGRLPNEEGAWTEVRSMHLGQAVAAGDFDADGLCDLAASSAQTPGNVFIYRGRRPQGLDPGGVEAHPSVWLTSDLTINENPEFGQRIAMGDVNGDGKSDLLVGHHGADHGGERNTGAGHLYLGRSLAAEEAILTLTSSDADWSFAGSAHDHAGMDVRIAEVNGSPPVDILLTSLYSDRNGQWDVGSIHAFFSRLNSLPAIEPSLSIHGSEQSFRLGVSAAPLLDFNHDNHPDFAAISHYGGTQHMRIGRPFIVESQVIPQDGELEMETPVEEENVDYRLTGLNLNWTSGGSFFGNGVALLGDIDGDGREEALVSASQSTHPEVGIRSGELWIYRMTPTGEIVDGRRVPPFLGHSEWDIMGSAKFIGDFDGDGHGDFAVQLNYDERPHQLGEDYFVPENCGSRHNDQGGIFIFRGGPEHFDLVPDFVYWGQSAGVTPDTFIGAGDFNGDGRADLAVGAWARSTNGMGRSGSVSIIKGQPDPAPNRLTVICSPQLEYFGRMTRHHIGFAVTYLDDFDGDGCDELAVGGRGYWTNDLHWRGSVHILHGFGGPGCASELAVTKLAPPAPWGQFGSALASGDLNGDGIPELAVGAPYAIFDNQMSGGVYVLDGEYLRTLRKHHPSMAPYEWTASGDLNLLIPGPSEGAETGRGVFIKNGFLGVVTTNDLVDNVAAVSTIRLYSADAQSHNELTYRGLIIGEPLRPGSLLGQRDAIGLHPQSDSIILGATRGGGVGRDNGSAYWVDLGALPR